MIDSAAIAIEFVNVHYRTNGNRELISGLNLAVRRGETLMLLGRSGSGKTTTLKLLMRLIFPTSGTARILDRDLQDVRMHERIGYLPENPYFYDYLTAREFLQYCAEIFGFPAAERKRRANALLARVNLDERRWDTQLRKFSKGMLQRVGLAQSLINDPEVVFLDEPMSGLDPLGRREVRDLIAALRQEGKTVFMCTHILSDIEVLCDRIAIMKSGKLSYVGHLDELRQKSGEETVFEVVVTGTDARLLEEHLSVVGNISIAETSNGLRVQVGNEKLIDAVIAALRKSGGQLVSVQPLRQSLEELFVNEAGAKN